MRELEINNRLLRIGRFNTREGMRVLSRLISIGGPALEKAFDGESDQARAGHVLVALVQQMNEEHVDWLIDLFSETTQIKLTDKGGWVKLSTGDLFEQTFASNYQSVIQWLGACLSENFADFLGSIGLTLAGTVKIGDSEQSQSPPK